jgi:hypothetical protein
VARTTRRSLIAEDEPPKFETDALVPVTSSSKCSARSIVPRGLSSDCLRHFQASVGARFP